MSGAAAPPRRLSLAPRPAARVMVASLVRDRPEVVQRLVAMNLRLGVSRLRLYFDDPDDPSLAWAAAQPGVEAVACDAAFWAAHAPSRVPEGEARPPWVEARQRTVFDHAYAALEPGWWIGFCDSDELFVPRHDYRRLLASAGEAEQLHAAVWEAFWAPGAPAEADFSAPLARRVLESDEAIRAVLRLRPAIFGLLCPSGVAGHRRGKALVRGGLGTLRSGIHRHELVLPDGGTRPLKTRSKALALIHWDAISAPAWVAKHRARLAREVRMGGNLSHRNAQTELVALCEGPTAERRLFDMLYGADPAYVAMLRQLGAVAELADLPAGDPAAGAAGAADGPPGAEALPSMPGADTLRPGRKLARGAKLSPRRKPRDDAEA